MVDNKKKKKLIIIAVLIVVFIVGGMLVAIMTNTGSNDVKTAPKSSQSTSKVSSKEKANESGQLSTSASSSSSSKENNVENVTLFLKDYFTWDLTNSSIDKRTENLKPLMTNKAYADNGIVQNGEQLKSLLKTFNETKEVDTSNSTALVSRKYVRSNVYQDASKKSMFYTEVYFKEKLIYQKDYYAMVAKYNITMENGKVAKLEFIENHVIKG